MIKESFYDEDFIEIKEGIEDIYSDDSIDEKSFYD